jgi:exosortase H (IPTLxxWG-CTERM-specific)
MARGPQSSPEGRRPLAFLARFAGLLVLSYFALAARPVNDAVVVPFTAGIARVCGAILGALGEPVAVEGTQIRSPAFSVEIENGCNGLETVLLFVCAVLAFPAPWKRRLAGLALGFAAIEMFNLVRVVTLFWIGAHRPSLFGASHTVVWQTLVVLFGVLLFLVWAARARAGQPRPDRTCAPE